MAIALRTRSTAALTAFAILLASRLAAQTVAQDDSIGELKKLSVEQLMDIEVTSVTKEPEKFLDADSAIQVVTGDEIDRSGASSLPEALELADNLDIAQKNSHDWAISARGFNTALANKLLVLMDGRTLYTPLYSGVFWDVQDYLLADIDRIEVISGPGGTLWGANAVNGVINITSKSAKDTQGLYFESGAGNELEDFASVRYGGEVSPGVYYRVYAKYSERGDEVFSDGDKATDSWRMAQEGFRMDVEKSAQTTLTLQGDYYDGHEGVETGGTADVRGDNVLGRITHNFADGSNMSLQIYYDHTYLADPVPPLQIGAAVLAPKGVLFDSLDTYDLDFQHHLNLGDANRFSWGFGYRFTHDFVIDAPSIGFLPSTLNQKLLNAFAQDEIKVTKDLFLTVGSKVERNDYTGTEWEPNVRLRWDLTPSQVLWAAVSRAVRTPSRIDHDLSEGSPPYFALLKGGPEFESETLVAYELGYRAQLGPQVSTSISAFYNEYNDVRSTGFSPVTVFPLVFQNNVAGDTRGIEYTTDYQASSWWRLHAGYDLLLENLGVKAGQTDVNDALNEVADPEHQVFLRSSMDLPRNVDLDGELRWIDKIQINSGSTLGTVPSYFELNLRVGWRPTRNLELSVTGENLLHDHHPEYGFPGPTREEISRSVFGKLAWSY